MILTLIFNKLKSLILVFINLFRRALCCFRRRRMSSCEAVPLTHVISSSDAEERNRDWADWDDNSANEPRTVQDHIEMYRKRKAQIMRDSQEPPSPEESPLNFFEDMAPNITRQPKVYLNTKHKDDSRNSSNRLHVSEEALQAVPSAELVEWEESSGWEGENLDSDAQRVLREQRRLERERKAWEKHQRRQEKNNRSLGSKLSA